MTHVSGADLGSLLINPEGEGEDAEIRGVGTHPQGLLGEIGGVLHHPIHAGVRLLETDLWC